MSPSQPGRDETNHAAPHHPADAEDGDDEGPDEGDGGVAGGVQRLPFLEAPTCPLFIQVGKEKNAFSGKKYKYTDSGVFVDYDFSRFIGVYS